MNLKHVVKMVALAVNQLDPEAEKFTEYFMTFYEQSDSQTFYTISFLYRYNTRLGIQALYFEVLL